MNEKLKQKWIKNHHYFYYSITWKYRENTLKKEVEKVLKFFYDIRNDLEGLKTYSKNKLIKCLLKIGVSAQLICIFSLKMA